MSTLGQKASSSVLWNAGFNLFRDVMQFVVMAVLVRLLAREAYGEFTLVTSIIGFITVFAFNNFVAYTLQVRDDRDTHYQEHFTAGGFFQISLFVLTNLLALGLRWIPKYAPVAPYVHAMSVLYLLDWPCEFRRKMLERRFDWKRLRLLHGVGILLNAAIAIGMALAGCGTYALVLPGLVVTFPYMWDLFVRERWRPTWAWSRELYAPAWKFGLTRIGSGMTSNGRQLLESGVLSGFLGFAALGVFNRSVGLAQLFCWRVAIQLMSAIYPVLTRVESGEKNLARVGGLVLRAVLWTVIPIAVSFGTLAQPVVQTVYGANWDEVIPLLPWTMGWGVSAALGHVSYMLLLARQQPHKCLAGDLIFLIGTGACLWLVLPQGTTFYLAAVAGVQLCMSALLLFWLRQAGGLSWSGMAEAVFPAVAAAVLSWLLASLAVRVLGPGGPDTFWRAVAWGVVFISSYVLVLRIGFVRQLTALVHYCPGRAPLARVLALRLPA